MHLILVSDRMATAKSVHIKVWHILLVGMGGLLMVLGVASLFSYVTVRYAAEIRLPFLQQMLMAMNAEESQRSKDYLRENLNAMAVKLGQMQAQQARLDALGDRLAATAGVKPVDIRHAGGVTGSRKVEQDGRGGPLLQATPLSASALQNSIDALAQQLEMRGDALLLVEAHLLDARIRQNRLPTSLPIAVPWNASTYGWRIDPITGDQALHEGVDFSAEIGTPINAAATGVVVLAERHPEYGNLIEIDHGHEITTRYAHASAMFVKPGLIVRRGQKIAEVGNTGRSTGPHLHFEVRLRGAAQNPNRFLQAAQAKDLDKLVRNDKPAQQLSRQR